MKGTRSWFGGWGVLGVRVIKCVLYVVCLLVYCCVLLFFVLFVVFSFFIPKFGEFRASFKLLCVERRDLMRFAFVIRSVSFLGRNAVETSERGAERRRSVESDPGRTLRSV